MFDSPYDFGNYISNGLLNSAKGAFNPKEPLSAQHWGDSAVTVVTVFPAIKTISTEVKPE